MPGNWQSGILPPHPDQQRSVDMPSRPDTDDYLSLFLNDVPLMDVRAPVEYAKGSFPGTVNAPLMNDEERHRIGICYKEKGQDKAIALRPPVGSGHLKGHHVEA